MVLPTAPPELGGTTVSEASTAARAGWTALREETAPALCHLPPAATTAVLKALSPEGGECERSKLEEPENDGLSRQEG